MASTDLSRLYQAKNTIEKYYGYENPLENSRKKEINKLTSERDTQLNELNKRYENLASKEFFVKRASIAIIVAIVLITVVLLGSGTFLSSVLSLDINSFILDMRDFVYNNPDSGLFSNLSGSEDIELIVMSLSFNILAVTLILGYGTYFLYKSIAGKDSRYLTWVRALGIIFAIATLVFFIFLPSWCEKITGIPYPDRDLGIIRVILARVLGVLVGIPYIIFTWKFALFVVALQLSLYIPWFTLCIMKERFVPKSKKCESISEEINSIRVRYKEKYNEIYNKYGRKIRSNPYLSQYNALPSYLQDYKVVTSLIWAIENGYANDIVSARNYWDRKAHDASVRRQLDKVQSTADAALKAASTPPEVKVDVDVTIR